MNYKKLGIAFNIVSLMVTPFILAVPSWLTPYFVATATATNAVALFCYGNLGDANGNNATPQTTSS